ncbi:MAG: phosphoglycolate phosphatase [Rhizobiaceae bacterium]|nr:MAG: phosphoglycolate phosphatase [Rhizobiaceae bacterium]
MTAPIIVFDLDGTLVDTAPDLLDSLNHSLVCAGLEHADNAELRGFVGLGARVMIQRAFAAHGKGIEDGELDRLLAVFLDHYTAHIPGKSALYPGVVAALDRFSKAGYALAVCTNKHEGLSRQLLGALGIAGRFAAICGGDTFAFRKPDPRHLKSTIAQAGGDPEHALMMGDSRTDIDTAKSAGIPVVAVDFGYTDRPVSEFEPSRVISHFDELTIDLATRLLGTSMNAPSTVSIRA